MNYPNRALSGVPYDLSPRPAIAQMDPTIGACAMSGPPLPIGVRPAFLPHLARGTQLRTNEDLPPALAENGLLVVLEGVLAHCVWAEPGKRRIVGVLVAGDVCRGLALCDRDREWFTALTPCRVARLPSTSIDHLIDDDASFAMELAQIAERTAAIQREWLRNDARSSELRLAHRICELMTRAGVWWGLAKGMILPQVRQTAWADMTAMTSIHVNRCLKRLVEAELICVAQRDLSVPDPGRLVAFSGFDAAYLQPVRHQHRQL